MDARTTSRRWVALLRGVNVGGVVVRSAELASLFRECGFTEVRTVLATGNVIFASTANAPRLTQLIEDALAQRFGYEARIVLLPLERLDDIIAGFPFGERDDRQPYVVFGSDQDVLGEIFSLAATAEEGERFATGDGVLYWEVPVGSSTTTSFAKLLSRSRFKPSTTTRNLRTLRKLL